MRPHQVFTRTLEMSIGREEFLRLFSSVVPSFQVDGETIRWSCCIIRLVPLTDRGIGSVTIPRHRVEIVLDACSEEEGENFMARFHRAFLRGGG